METNNNIINRLGLEGAVERIDPQNTAPGILSIHLKRYQFVLPYCRDKRVLDAACGVGYGSAYLADVASSVVGLDIDDQAIHYAQEHYQANNLMFQVQDVTETYFPASSFDTICSFETIEHLPDISAYLREITRVLKPDGIYVVSTPQVPKTNPHPQNPYHTIEFSKVNFEALLKLYFGDVKLYGQRRKQSEIHYWITLFLNLTGLRKRLPRLGKIRDSINKTLQTQTFDNMALEDILITVEKIERASEIVAVCKIPKKI